MPREIPVIPAEKILELSPTDVLLTWRCTIPASGLRECEVRLAKEAAAAAGFDLVKITANIHPTTSRGARQDKPHMNVTFSSTRYYAQTNQNCHINVHVWNPRVQEYTRYPSNNRPDDYPYQHVCQDGLPNFYRELPKTLARNEINAAAPAS